MSQECQIQEDVENVVSDTTNQFVFEITTPNQQIRQRKPQTPAIKEILLAQLKLQQLQERVHHEREELFFFKPLNAPLQMPTVSDIRSTAVRVLLDTGSQRTYSTNSLKSRLGLKPIEKENIRLNTFGDDRLSQGNL